VDKDVSSTTGEKEPTMLKQLAVTGLAALSLAACGTAASTTATPSSSATPSSTAGSANSGTGIGDGAPTYVSQFRQQFPDLAAGKTNAQILSDGEADCADMAAARKLTTPAMAHRYGLDDSAVAQFTLYNIALLSEFTLCGIRGARDRSGKSRS
jgi:hypothetical protein